MIKLSNWPGALRIGWLIALLMGSIAVGSCVWRVQGDREDPAGFWVADRDGDRLVRLDADLLVAATLAVRAPVAVYAGLGGLVWTISAGPGPDGVAHRLLAYGPSGSSVAPSPISSLFELRATREVAPDTRFASLPGTGGYAVERTGESLRWLHRLGSEGVDWSLDLSGAGTGPVSAGCPYEEFVPDAEGGGLLVAAGHVLRINRWGEAAGGQGGFVFARSAFEVRR